MKRTLKNVLKTVMRTYKTVIIKPCINREAKRNISLLNYSVTVVGRTSKFLEVVTPTSFYH